MIDYDNAETMEHVAIVARDPQFIDQPERNRFLKRRDEDLAIFEEQLRKAREMIEEVIVGFAMYAPPQHQKLPTLIDQQIEQIIQYRWSKQ